MFVLSKVGCCVWYPVLVRTLGSDGRYISLCTVFPRPLGRTIVIVLLIVFFCVSVEFQWPLLVRHLGSKDQSILWTVSRAAFL